MRGRFVCALVFVLGAGACDSSSAPRETPVTACGDSLTFGVSEDHALAIRFASEEMLPGRSQDAVAGEISWGTGYWLGPASAPVTWCSSDSTVVDIVGGELHAVAPGTAAIYASDAAGMGDSVVVHVGTGMYDVIFVGADVGDSSTAVALNDSGDVVVATPTTAFLWHDHDTT